MIKKIFHKLPLPLIIKRKIINFVFLNFPIFLKYTQVYQNYLQQKKSGYLTTKSRKLKKYSWTKLKKIKQNISEPRIGFTTNGKPKISIIIPVFNKIEFTFNCLKSIAENSDDVDYEVIVVDDCSTDDTSAVLSKVDNIRVIRNKKNNGYINSCNAAVQGANGDYLVFLNNDTMVTEGWLTWLIKTFEIFPDVGLVGAKLIFPNGRLQEAGSIVWRDGSANNYGRMDDPSRPEYNYAREVDYCSGACLMIPRKLFIDVGMYDSRFSPAYYEDVDLAFKVRKHKRKVIYQPKAEVFHFEGITSGNDISSGIKQYQSINQGKFFNKWEDVLLAHVLKGESIDLEKDHFAKKRVLIIDAGICKPDRDAGSLRMFHMARIIKEMGHKISFFPKDCLYPEPYTGDMEGLGIEVLTDIYIESLERHLRKNGSLYDIVILSRLETASRYIDAVKKYCNTAKIIFDTVDLVFLREQRAAVLFGSDDQIRKAEEIKRNELAVAAKADLTLVVSTVEKNILNKELPAAHVEIVSTIQPVSVNRAPFAERKDLLFIGGFNHLPNVDAVNCLVREILPLIRKQKEGIKLFIIGSDPPPEIKSLSTGDIIITGYVEDVAPFFRQCRVFVAPLRYGAGVKGKINLSMSCGLPVVTTPIGVEGMHLTDGKDVLIAGNPDDFTDAVLKLYSKEDLWDKLSINGVENVRTYFSVEKAAQTLNLILNADNH